MKNKRLIMLFVACVMLMLVALPVLSACSSSGDSNTAGKVIKLGISTPTTGPAAEKGRPMGDANLDAIEYINNELGGINGYQVEAIWRDNGYNAANMVTIVKNFMDTGALMFCTSSSAMMTASMETANRASFPGLAAFSSPVIYRPPEHIYGQLPDYGDDFLAFARYYLDNVWQGSGKPKIAIEALNNSTGKGAIDAARAYADQLGIDILWDGAVGKAFEHKADTTSEMEALTRIKAMNPDALYISSTPAPTAVIIKNAHDLDMFPGITIASGHAGFTKALIDLAGADIAEGVYGVFPTVSWGDDVPGMAKVMEYAEKNHPDDIGNGDYITSWAQSLIMAKAIETAMDNGVSYDTLAKGGEEAWTAVETKGIQKLDYDVEGLHGPVKYTPGDNRLSKSVRVFKVENGEITALTDWIEAPVVKYEDFSWFGQ